MTLSGGTLLDVPISERIAGNSETALDDVLHQCAADPACQAAFPNLRADWNALLPDLAANPVTVPGAQTPNHQPFTLTAELFAQAVHQLLLSVDDATQLPALIHSLATTHDRVPVLARDLREFAGRDLLGGEDEFLIMFHTIRCNEPWARFDPAAVSQYGRGSYYLPTMLASARYWQRVCTVFPSTPAEAEYGPAAAPARHSCPRPQPVSRPAGPPGQHGRRNSALAG
jgi:hypothetical protein